MTTERLLKAELERRCQKNPRYSLRAFARALGISHTHLSLILSGKRELSSQALLRICDIVQLGPRERSELLQSSKHGKKQQPSRALKTRMTLEMEQFEFIADWHHYAILSLLEIPESRWSAKFFAKRLAISESQASLAMERLQRLGLVAPQGDRYKQTGLPIKIENAISTAATRKHHAQLLEKAAESLENEPAERRDFSGITFAMSPANVAYAKERIRAFRRELSEELEEMGEPAEVYELSVQLYPLSQNRGNLK